MARLIIEVTTKHVSGPRADTSCYPGDIEAELDGMQIEVQDPEKDEPELVEVAVKRIELVQ